MHKFNYYLRKSITGTKTNNRALFLVLISGACFGIFLTLGSINVHFDNSLLYSPLFISGGALLYVTIWIFYTALLSFRLKSEPESLLIRDSVTYLPSVLLLAYVISFSIKAESIYPGITPPYEHLMKTLFLFFALLIFALIISLKIFVHGHFEKICTKNKSNVSFFVSLSAFFIIYPILTYLMFNALNHYGGDIAASIQRIWFITKTGVPKSTIFFVPVGGEPVVLEVSRQLPVYLATPFYLFYHHPASHLIAQTFFVAITAIPVYLIGKDVLKSSFLGCLLSTSFLFHPTTQYLYLQALHEDTFGMAFLAFALYFLYKRKHIPFLISSALMVICKMNFFLVGIFLGFYAIIRELVSLRDKETITYGLLCVAFSMLWAYFIFVVIPPPPAAGVEFFMGRYDYLGGSVSEALHIILTRPLFVLSHAFTTAKIAYLGTLLLPLFIVLPLLSGVFFIAIPILAQNLLSTTYTMYSILYQYSAILIPILYISAIKALSKIKDSEHGKLKRVFENISGGSSKSDVKNLVISSVFLILMLSLICSTIYGPFGYIYKVNASEVSEHSVYFESFLVETPQDRIAKEIASQIPKNASVIVQEPFQILLAERERIYRFPCRAFSEECVGDVTPESVDYVVLNLNNPRLKNLNGWKEWVEGLEREGWEKFIDRKGFFVFKSKSKEDS